MNVIKTVLKYFKIRSKQKLDEYWIQRLHVKRMNDRMILFKKLCTSKKVLHFGCTDYPIFDPKNNLHIKLSGICGELHGFDIDIEGIKNLRQYFNSTYFTDFAEINNHYYDVCLVPETIEHVDNVGKFLTNISNINCSKFIITGPNCFHSFFNNHFNESKSEFIEAIHPDHNCWYSPYTLKNVIEKYSTLIVENVYLANNDLMIICECKKKS